MRVKIDKAGQDVLIVCQIDHPRAARIAPRWIGIHFQELAITNYDASVATDVIADRVKEPSTAENYVAGLKSEAHLSE